MPRGSAPAHGRGPYAGGTPPREKTRRGHTSNPKRFMDSEGFQVVPWTAEMALRKARVDPSLPRAKQVEAIRNAIDDDELPEIAVAALVKDGWTELES